ncbi:cyclophilin type peptidyl-prolyl cis-trans isomerase [Nitzschia inconspicua]|uniref:peptidylprolyl isomerase n=1 Tax=Nitzschia inconspicua TaxID=303405 RepID=A0A9K3PXN2_9STRA|nr:cyclophilin type peptidyl-prolyl cis-trans isomerase [Nitzschia inconspicua]
MTKTQILFETTEGSFKAELFTDEMPITCGNIIDLMERKFYDGLYIHRIAPDFCVQFGCPYALNPHVIYGTLDEDAGQGSGPPDTTFLSCSGKEHTRDEYGNIEDELVKGLSNEEGTLSMANSGDPDTGGSQFFINTKDNRHLDWWNGSSESAHPVFGKIVEGYEIIKKIEGVEISAEQPVNPIKMISVTIEKE